MKHFALILLALALGALPALAQDTGDGNGDGEETTGPQTTVEIFFVACDDLGVVNLNGFATPGFDIFFQIFNGSSGSGEALTSLRRANVDGDYAFSERTPYRDGQRVAPGAIASMRVLIAASDTPDNPAFETTVDDLQDGCNDAQNPLQTSSDAGDPVIDSTSGTTDSTSGIVSPDGGLLNPEIVVTPLPEVVIGPRPSAQAAGRTANPGLIFAQCDSFFPETDPGLVYDSDNVRVFWYWFADTPETLQQNLSVTNYQVTINNAPISQVQQSGVVERNGVFYNFFTVPVGNVRPGFYEVSFRQTWSEPINDGFDDFGPGTPVTQIQSTCNFEVVRNPSGATVSYSGMYIGGERPSHNFEQARIRQQAIRNFLEQSSVGQRDGG